MKLRLHDNTLRLRLTPGEVARIAAGGAVEATLPLEPLALRYRLESSQDARQPAASFAEGLLRVVLPNDLAQRWATGQDVGITADCGNVRLLIEKDFRCLHGEEADETDRFPNPLAGESD